MARRKVNITTPKSQRCREKTPVRIAPTGENPDTRENLTTHRMNPMVTDHLDLTKERMLRATGRSTETITMAIEIIIFF